MLVFVSFYKTTYLNKARKTWVHILLKKVFCNGQKIFVAEFSTFQSWSDFFAGRHKKMVPRKKKLLYCIFWIFLQNFMSKKNSSRISGFITPSEFIFSMVSHFAIPASWEHWSLAKLVLKKFGLLRARVRISEATIDI